MGDANPYRLHTCYHCLNTGLMKILHREIYQEYVTNPTILDSTFKKGTWKCYQEQCRLCAILKHTQTLQSLPTNQCAS